MECRLTSAVESLRGVTANTVQVDSAHVASGSDMREMMAQAHRLRGVARLTDRAHESAPQELTLALTAKG